MILPEHDMERGREPLDGVSSFPDRQGRGMRPAVRAAFTGYRPAKLYEAAGVAAETILAPRIDSAVAGLYCCGYRCFLTGMAEGFDLLAAERVLALRDAGICPEACVVAVVPFAGQERSYGKRWIEAYRTVSEAAGEVVTLSDHYYRDCFLRRNDYLVDHASALVCCFDGRRGGTAYTVSRARRRGLRIENVLDPQRELF